MINDQIAKKLKVAKFKAQTSLLFYTRYFYKKRYKRKFIVNDHHKKMSDALERVLKGELTRLIINIAPRYSKTELAVINFISHGLGLNPSAKFIHLTYADTLALDNSEEIKDLVQSAEYQEIFPEVQIKLDSRAKNKWYTTEGGGVLARASGGQVTGFGAGAVDEEEDVINTITAEDKQEEEDIDEFLTTMEIKKGFSGAIIIDDPIKPDDANSDVVRERVNNRFETTIRNRVNSRNTPIIVIGQRVHPEDLSGYLKELEPDEWEVLSLPCLSTNEKGEYQALWPFKHTVKELLHLKKITPITFDTQYQQDPEPKEGLLFPKDQLHYYNPKTVKIDELSEFKFAYIDPADDGGDDLSMPICHLIGDKIYVTDVIYNTKGTDVNENACVDKITRNKLNSVYIESNSAWILFAKSVRNKVEKKYADCEIRVVKNTKNKHTRILAQSAFIINNFVFRKDYENHPEYAKFMKNIHRYKRIQTGSNRNAHDDAPDSCTGVATYFATNFAHLW